MADSRTSRTRKRARDFRQFGVAAAIAIVAVLSFSTPAFAHNYYTSSTPKINEVLTALPSDFSVTTNDNLLDLGGAVGGFIMEVTGPDGLYYGDGCVTVSGPSVSMGAALGPAGAYKLNWQVISADGHTVSGEVPFSWKPSPDAKTTTGVSSPPNCGGTSVGAQTPAPGSASDAASDASSASMTDILWIGGAVLAVALAGLATFLVLGRKKK